MPNLIVALVKGFDRWPQPWQTTPPSATDHQAGQTALVKGDLGTKRVCPSCGARFYDLSKRPIECPKCNFAFEPEAMYKQRRPRQPEPAPAPEPVAEVEEEEEEVEEAEEEAIVEPVADEPAIETAEEEEEEAAPEEPEAPRVGISVVEGEDAAIEDIEETEDEEEEDDSLLEEVEEDEDDVTGIIDADIEKDER
ncbi:MAG: TIGR02300 family protein [Alphaproteobacteria bacterium]|nr:TIGR02300 family protein [Alphaproteobacteria bacterium]